MKQWSRWVLFFLLWIGIVVYLLMGKTVLGEISVSKKYTECAIENAQSQEKERWGISPKEALFCLKKEEEKEEPEAFLFWREKKSQTIENTELSREGSFPVMEICGNSALLFPGEFPLDKENAEGCLIGESIAWELFGDTNVIGKMLIYGRDTYYIQGVLPKTNIFLCQAEMDKDVLLDKLTFYADSYSEKNRIKEQLGNEYNLILKEVPAYWSFIFKRTALFLFPACILLCFLFRARKNKLLFRSMIFIAFIFFMAGIVFIFDITPDKLPNRLSDIDFWTEAFQKGMEDFFSFLHI